MKKCLHSLSHFETITHRLFISLLAADKKTLKENIMGNRAVITASNTKNAPCIYLHWNGGRASVEGFLAAARYLSIRGTDSKTFDAIAETIASYFFGCKVGFTVYRETYGRADTDNWDNGVYVIDADLNIVGRKFKRSSEEVNPEKTQGIFEQIVSRAPVYNA